jgi:hypothetical protein
MRQNLYQNNIRHFHSVMSEYNGSVNEFKQNLQDFQRRQLKYVDNKEGNGLNDEQIEKIIESGQANEFIKKVCGSVIEIAHVCHHALPLLVHSRTRHV